MDVTHKIRNKKFLPELIYRVGMRNHVLGNGEGDELG
jgi:hypothetical protein